MEQRHKHADVIIAWAEGKDVQVWNSVRNEWQESSNPNWFLGYEYRIKPPARRYRVALFNINGSSYTYTHTADNQKTAEFYEATPAFVRWLTDWVEYEE